LALLIALLEEWVSFVRIGQPIVVHRPVMQDTGEPVYSGRSRLSMALHPGRMMMVVNPSMPWIRAWTFSGASVVPAC
jgi:hypothetical protein